MTAAIALTGVTGALGGLVVRALADDFRLDLRLLARDPSRAPDLDTDLRACDYADPAGAEEALRGVRTLFMVSASESADRRAQHRAFIGAAARAGVEHVVYTSFAGAAPDATFTLGRDHADAEAAIRESGMAFTILRTLRGPEALTLAEVAERAGAVLGRELRFVDETEDEAYAWRRDRYGAEQWQDAWVSTYTAIRDGSVAEVTDDVRRVAGHPPRTLEEALRS
ncbi:NAD(P)H-binding protein [Nocardioides pantholopis]|uniref:NAD(P)H-binding protein n=1 Tax=Nocardioides pantholopis TaxID=2483798 RepID=UPI000FDBDFC1|nr:NAD(P)H-binding protein [Nocardioides pantholopis]